MKKKTIKIINFIDEELVDDITEIAKSKTLTFSAYIRMLAQEARKKERGK